MAKRRPLRGRCETNDKDKTTSIDDAEGLITDLTVRPMFRYFFSLPLSTPILAQTPVSCLAHSPDKEG